MPRQKQAALRTNRWLDYWSYFSRQFETPGKSDGMSGCFRIAFVDAKIAFDLLPRPYGAISKESEEEPRLAFVEWLNAHVTPKGWTRAQSCVRQENLVRRHRHMTLKLPTETYLQLRRWCEDQGLPMGQGVLSLLDTVSKDAAHSRKPLRTHA